MLPLGLLLAVVPLALAQFPFPPQGFVFTTGETQTIRWHTIFPNFTIGLWQQAQVGGFATLGPILIQTTNGPTVTQVDWVVQTYGFDLRSSDRFFFWLIQGDATQQGNQSASGFSSAIFNIAEQDSPPSSLSSQLTTTSATAHTPTSSSTAISDTTPRSGQAEGLGAGSLAGIAVGVTLAGIAAISGSVYWVVQTRDNQKELVIQLNQQTAKLNQHAYEQGTFGKQEVAVPTLLEKSNDRHTGCVELG